MDQRIALLGAALALPWVGSASYGQSPATQPSPRIVEVFERKGKLLTKDQYERALASGKTEDETITDQTKPPAQPPSNALTSTDEP